MSKIIIFSGAGISAESGVSTFRDSGGLWEKHKIEDICTAGCLEYNREGTIRFYDERRLELKNAQPNKAHIEIAKLKKNYPNEIAVITQNVDNLFEKAGLIENELTHLHGELTKLQCEECHNIYDIGYQKQEEFNNGICPKCHSKKLRPFIVMFGEMAPKYEVLNREIQDCELIVVIGTSGYVIGVNTLANFVDYSILNNLEPSPVIEERLFSKVYYKKATEAIDDIKEDIEDFLKRGALRYFK